MGLGGGWLRPRFWWTQFCWRPYLVWPLRAYKARLVEIDAIGCGGETVAQRQYSRPTGVANRPMSGLYRCSIGDGRYTYITAMFLHRKTPMR